MKNPILFYSETFSYFLKICFKYTRKVRFLCVLLCFAIFTSSCSSIAGPAQVHDCKMHAYINAVFPDYIKSRYNNMIRVRLAVLPFDVPESFASNGAYAPNYGLDIARDLVGELYRSGQVSIVELLNRDRWPGKKEEFFTGNYGAIQIARDAGFNFVMVGQMAAIQDSKQLRFYSKLIDTTNSMTIWYGQTEIATSEPAVRRMLTELTLAHAEPSQLDFAGRVLEFASCTVNEIFNGKPVPY